MMGGKLHSHTSNKRAISCFYLLPPLLCRHGMAIALLLLRSHTTLLSTCLPACLSTYMHTTYQLCFSSFQIMRSLTGNDVQAVWRGGRTGREEYEGAIAGSIPVISQYGIGTGLDWLRGATPRSLQCAFFRQSMLERGSTVGSKCRGDCRGPTYFNPST